MAIGLHGSFLACRDNRTQPHLNLNFGHINLIATSELTSPRELGRVSGLIPLFSDCQKSFSYMQSYSIAGRGEHTPGITGLTISVGIPGIVAVVTHDGDDTSNPYEHRVMTLHDNPEFKRVSQPGPAEGRVGLILYQVSPVVPGSYAINATEKAAVILTDFNNYVQYGYANPIGTVEVYTPSCEFHQPEKTISFGKIAWGDDTIESSKVKFSLGFNCSHGSLPAAITFSANDGSSHDNIYLNNSEGVAKNVAIRLYDENTHAISINSKNEISLNSGDNSIVLQANLVKLNGDVVPGRVDATATVNITYK
ncbi:fimbrial protein [Aeromonas dhakensis]|uniref:fimbrial protein n=1 Tax=Aeromonas dhakensis TaxID=196024 RepID=UPI003437B640